MMHEEREPHVIEILRDRASELEIIIASVKMNLVSHISLRECYDELIKINRSLDYAIRRCKT